MCPTTTHDPFPRASLVARVASNRELAPGVFELVCGAANGDRASVNADIPANAEIPAPEQGQFFMLRARPSATLLGRPISVYRSNGETVTFLILKKGRGTEELCALRAGDELDLLGPIGNRFVLPSDLVANGLVSSSALSLPPSRAPRVALIGGGIGVAPVAGFSFFFEKGSFDLYASFRSTPYGLDGIESRAAKVAITTEDGSAGVKGMLPAVFNADHYDLVYACGPTPMLRYVQGACATSRDSRSAGGKSSALPVCFLSLEEHMACGAGACLGCTVKTVAGNRRCCVDGPVFNGAEVIL